MFVPEWVKSDAFLSLLGLWWMLFLVIVILLLFNFQRSSIKLVCKYEWKVQKMFVITIFIAIEFLKCLDWLLLSFVTWHEDDIFSFICFNFGEDKMLFVHVLVGMVRVQTQGIIQSFKLEWAQCSRSNFFSHWNLIPNTNCYLLC